MWSHLLQWIKKRAKNILLPLDDELAVDEVISLTQPTPNQDANTDQAGKSKEGSPNNETEKANVSCSAPVPEVEPNLWELFGLSPQSYGTQPRHHVPKKKRNARL